MLWLCDFNERSLVLTTCIGWATVYGATAVVGNVAVVTMGGSAWCRFASDNRRSMVAQAVACPVFIFLAFATGIIVTSASTQVLGVAYWQPFELMRCKTRSPLSS